MIKRKTPGNQTRRLGDAVAGFGASGTADLTTGIAKRFGDADLGIADAEAGFGALKGD